MVSQAEDGSNALQEVALGPAIGDVSTVYGLGYAGVMVAGLCSGSAVPGQLALRGLGKAQVVQIGWPWGRQVQRGLYESS